jgi:hypothetical protein
LPKTLNTRDPLMVDRIQSVVNAALAPALQTRSKTCLRHIEETSDQLKQGETLCVD